MIAFWIAVIGGLTTFVMVANQNKPEMVRDNYYEAGLKEDLIINQARNAQKHNFTVKIVDSTQSLSWIASVKQQKFTAPILVELYRPNQRKQDTLFVLNADSSGIYRTPFKLGKGQWKLAFLTLIDRDSARIEQDYFQQP